MHAIDALLCGVRGAENGFARIYQRGTSTRATWYSDFEASSSDSTGDDIPLDANGGAVVYVNELVLVRVYDSQGNLEREFVAGSQAYAVEVISSGFTGTDYVTGASGLSKPTTAGALFDLWFASAGAPDWKGLYNGSSTLLQYIFGALFGLVYNPRSPEYGAEGDGTTNDLAAIQAAHDAAKDAGGGVVFFPPGTYLHTNKLVWSTSVSAVAIPGSVTLLNSHATAAWISIEDSLGNDVSTLFYGLAFDATQDNTGAQISNTQSSSGGISIVNCTFGGIGVSTHAKGDGILTTSDDSPIFVTECEFQTNDAAGTSCCIRSTAAIGEGYVSATRCRFVAATTTRDAALVLSANNSLFIAGCEFNLVSGIAGVPVGVSLTDAVGKLTVTGCQFVGTSAFSSYGISIFEAGIVDAVGNVFVDVIRYLRPGGTETASPLGHLELRSYIRFVTAGTTGTVTPAIAVEIMRFDSTIPTITLSDGYISGQQQQLIVHNNSGGAWAALSIVGLTNISGSSMPSISAGARAVLDMTWGDITTSGTEAWHVTYISI